MLKSFFNTALRPEKRTTPMTSRLSMSLTSYFKFEADLNEKGNVECKSERSEPVVIINRQRLDSDPQFSKAINDLAAKIRDAFDFPSTDQNKETPRLAGWGAVAHEVGTMRMATPHRKGVVDKDLKVHDYENLYVCDLSIFPLSPMANPSLTLTALAMRLGDMKRVTCGHVKSRKSRSARLWMAG